MSSALLPAGTPRRPYARLPNAPGELPRVPPREWPGVPEIRPAPVREIPVEPDELPEPEPIEVPEPEDMLRTREGARHGH